MDEEESSGGALLPSLLDDIEESNVRLGNPEASQQPQPTLQEETQPEANTGRGEDDVASGINVLGSQGVASSPVIELRRTQGIPYIDQDGPIDRMDPGLNRTQGSEAQANYVCRTPPLKRSRSAVVSPESPEQEDVTACPICYEGYTNSGAHRLVSLKCGHVFGQRCVERWLRGTGQRCPSCNSHAKLKDLRVIYVTSLKAIDTAERDRALEQLEKVQEEKRKLELEHTHTRLLCNTLQKENAHLRQKLREQNEKLSRLRQMERIHSKEVLMNDGDLKRHAECMLGLDNTNIFVGSNIKLELVKKLEISALGGCRVMHFRQSLNGMCIISHPVAMGFGIRKVCMYQQRVYDSILLHKKEIRDLAFSPHQQDLVLSVSLDKTCRLTQVQGNTLVHVYEASGPLWCGCWSETSPHEFFIGSQRGVVEQFDVRQPHVPISQLTFFNSQPVVQMAFVHNTPPLTYTPGLVVAQLNSVSYHAYQGEWHGYPVVLDGPFNSVSVADDSVLISSRPSSRHAHSRHTICKISDSNDLSNIVKPVQIFKGATSQNVLSRSTIYKTVGEIGERLMISVSDDVAKTTSTWDVNSSMLVSQIHSPDPVLDLSYNWLSQQEAFLTALTGKSLFLYKFHA